MYPKLSSKLINHCEGLLNQSLCLAGEAAADRVDAALKEVRPIKDLRTEDTDLNRLRERVKQLEEVVVPGKD